MSVAAVVVAISAVVCTHNRASLLEKCIQGLLGQTLSRDQYEIIVVDNGSTDSTAEVLARYDGIPGFRTLYEPVAGLSRARNLGWKNALAPYIGYIDDDAVADPKWLESALCAFQNVRPEPGWVGGPVELEWETEQPGWMTQELRIPLGGIDWGDEARWLLPTELLIGANSCFSRACLKKYGGFDERLGRQGSNLLSGEETKLKQQIEGDGGALYYHPGVRVRHFVPKERTWPAWFYRRYYWGGVSDFVMQRTLDGAQPPPGDHVGDQESHGRVGRLANSLLKATGLFCSRSEAIHARIYLCYVIGYLSGFFRWKR